MVTYPFIYYQHFDCAASLLDVIKITACFPGMLNGGTNLYRAGVCPIFEAGSVADTTGNILDTEIITAYGGGGVRWQVTEDKLLNLGLDVGFSQVDHAVYVNIGERF